MYWLEHRKLDKDREICTDVDVIVLHPQQPDIELSSFYSSNICILFCTFTKKEKKLKKEAALHLCIPQCLEKPEHNSSDSREPPAALQGEHDWTVHEHSLKFNPASCPSPPCRLVHSQVHSADFRKPTWRVQEHSALHKPTVLEWSEYPAAFKWPC